MGMATELRTPVQVRIWVKTDEEKAADYARMAIERLKQSGDLVVDGEVIQIEYP